MTPRQLPLPDPGGNFSPVGRNHPGTSHAAWSDAYPRTGTFKRDLLQYIADHDGVTDDDLEIAFRRSHQSVSATRNRLMNDGWIEKVRDPHTGVMVTRLTRYGNHAHLWRLTMRGRGEWSAYLRSSA